MPPASLLYVRLQFPVGTKVAFRPGQPQQLYEAPLTFGLRPGYRYRFEVSHFPRPDAKLLKLYPSLDVIGALHPPKDLDLSKHPVVLTLNDDDLNRVLDGGMVTKLYYLENPDTALPQESTKTEPIEFQMPSVREALEAAGERGRPMLLFRVGSRPLTESEFAAANVANTILLPGEKYLPAPPLPPIFRYDTAPLSDPLLGPKPTPEECLHDGGDQKMKLAISPEGRLFGLDPSDTAIEYTIGNRKGVEASCRVCLCVPRFVAIRVEAAPHDVHQPTPPLVQATALRGEQAIGKLPPQLVRNTELPRANVGTLKPSIQMSFQGPRGVDLFAAPAGVAQVNNLLVAANVVEALDITAVPNCKMMLKKSVDPPHGPYEIGDVVTFTLRYHNPGSVPIKNVAISDSLTARLEYIPGSAKSDREASFTTNPNEAGSLILRWDIAGELKPGQTGVVTFQAKIK